MFGMDTKRSRAAAGAGVLGFAVALVAAVGCAAGPAATVPLLKVAGTPNAASVEADLEVVTKATAIPDPLPVHGTRVDYAELEPSLGHAVASAAASWAHEHGPAHPDGWRLLVELTQASAEYQRGRLMVALNVRATLRTRKGNVYLAQTHANCSQAALVAPQEGAPVVFSCMSQIGRDLAGWLSGLDA